MNIPDEWPSLRKKDRTRLTDPLIFLVKGRSRKRAAFLHFSPVFSFYFSHQGISR